MEKVPEIESHMTSAAAFVEGGIQESCDDACSICLEEFCESDPSTVTTCRHEFHLQCILEWCQRSSQCPMCWQPISLKDPTSQELFEGIEQERKWRVTPSRNATIFNHPALGDFGLQHLRMGVNDDDFEERLLQHLAAAAMGRAHHLGRRERLRMQSSPHGHPHFLVLSTQPDAHSSSPGSAAGRGDELAVFPTGSPSAPITSDGDEPSQHIPKLETESSSSAKSQQGIYTNNRDSGAHSSPINQDGAGPSDFESFSDSLRSRLSAVSLRYKESISKGAKGWKERLFSGSSSMSDLGSEARKDVNTGVASVSRLAESPETRTNNRAVGALSNHLEDCSMSEASNQNNVEAIGDNSSRDNTPACSASSHSS